MAEESTPAGLMPFPSKNGYDQPEAKNQSHQENGDAQYANHSCGNPVIGEHPCQINFYLPIAAARTGSSETAKERLSMLKRFWVFITSGVTGLTSILRMMIRKLGRFV